MASTSASLSVSNSTFRGTTFVPIEVELFFVEGGTAATYKISNSRFHLNNLDNGLAIYVSEGAL